MGKVWCGGLSLSDAKAVIREARSAIGGCGKYQGEAPWVAWLHQHQDLASRPDFEIGSVDERGWAGVWAFDGFRFSEGEHQLFRPLRCQDGIAAVLTENSDGFVRGWLWSGGDAELEAMLERDYGPRCSACGGVLQGQDLDDGDGGEWCSLCAGECADCGKAFLLEEMHTVEFGDHKGEFMCHGCCSPCSCEAIVANEDMVELADGDFACPVCAGRCAECGDSHLKSALFAVDHEGVCRACLAEYAVSVPAATTACVDPVAVPAVDHDAVAFLVGEELRSMFGLLSPAVRQDVLGCLVDHLIGDDVAAAQAAARFAKVLRDGGAS